MRINDTDRTETSVPRTLTQLLATDASAFQETPGRRRPRRKAMRRRRP